MFDISTDVVSLIENFKSKGFTVNGWEFDNSKEVNKKGEPLTVEIKIHMFNTN